MSETMINTWGNLKFHAERTNCDVNGNSLELDFDGDGKVSGIGGKSIAAGVGEAPEDGKLYGRKNGTWSEVEGGETHECNTFVAVLELTSAVAGNGPSADELRAAKTANKAIIVKVVEDSATVYSAAIIEDDGTNLGVMFTMANQVFSFSVNGTRWTKLDAFSLVEEADKDGTIYGRKNGAWVEVEGGIEEAPTDGKTYARKDEEWTEVPGGGSAMARFAHWSNENGWQFPTTSPYTFNHTSTVLAEGDLTESSRPHAPPGVYHFDAEVSFFGEILTDDFVKYDAAIKYGTKTLREISLVNDNSWPAKDLECIQNHHFGGVFKLDDEGDIDLVLIKGEGGPHMNVKFSHLFLYKLGDI